MRDAPGDAGLPNGRRGQTCSRRYRCVRQRGRAVVERPTNSLRILVAEDCRDTAATMAELLQLWGYEACWAHDGPSALAAAETHRPDVVLIDVALPGMSGWDLAARLRQQPHTKDALLVAITGYGREIDRRQAHAVGIDHFFLKPADPEQLKSLLADWRVQQ